MIRPARLLFIALCGALLLAALPAGIANADVRFPPGMRIGLEPPAGMLASTRFAGFEDIDGKAAITLFDLPGPAYQQIERAAFAPIQKGLSDLKREVFPFANGIGVLITGTVEQNGQKIQKWFLLANINGRESEIQAMMVNAEAPADSKVYTDAVIRKALASVAFRPTPMEERLSLLPFKLGELSGFRVMQVLAAGGVIITEGPKDDISQQPHMIISAGPGAPPNPDDRGRFARNLLSSAPLANVRITLAEPIRITGVPGYEIRAQAEGPRGPVSLVQWVRYSGSGYLRVVGVTPRDKWDDMFMRFRAVRDGISFR